MRGEVWAGTLEGIGQRQRTSNMHAGRGPGCEGWWAYRACAERTWNMLFMFVTLDVSKLSGWLNAAADYRDERRVCDAMREVRAERRGGAGGNGGASSV